MNNKGCKRQGRRWNQVMRSFSTMACAGSIWLVGLAIGGGPVMAQTVGQGNALFQQGRVNDAIAVFQSLLQREPDNFEARLGLALAYQKAGRDADAWTTFQQVLVRQPKNPVALRAVGTLGGYRPAWQAGGIEALTTLLSLEGSQTDRAVLAQRALLYGYQGRWAEALMDYEQLLPQNPAAETVLAAAQAYTYSGNPVAGLALFQRYQATGKVVPMAATIAYAQALRETGRPAEAVSVLVESGRSQVAPANAGSSAAKPPIEWQTALAVAYQANGQSEQAQALIANLRQNPMARLPLARSLTAMGRQTGDPELMQEAIALYRQVLDAEKDASPGLLTEIADVMSESPPSRTEALMLYQKLSQQLPQDPGVKIKQAYLAYKLGELPRVGLIEQLQAAVQPLPASLAGQQLLAQALVRIDPPPVALISTYQTLGGVAGLNVPFLRFRLAQLLLATNQIAEARQAIAAYSATPVGKTDLATELLLAEGDRRGGNLDASATRYEQLITTATRPDLVTAATRGLAGIRVAQGQLPAALQLYDQLFSRNPEDAATLLGRASLAYQTQRISLTEAETVLAPFAQSVIDPPSELFSLVGALPPDANRAGLYQELLGFNPLDLGVQRRSLQLLALKDPILAKQKIRDRIQATPDNVDLYFLLADVARIAKDLPTAGQAYADVLKLQPENIDALTALGGVRFEQQRFAEATDLYHRALALRPQNWDAYRILVELSLAQDRPFAALQQLKTLETKQAGAGIVDQQVGDLIDRISVERLKRRGFQPAWELY